MPLGGGGLLDDECVAAGVARQKRRDRAEQRILDRRESARSADDEIGVDDVDHLVCERLAYATCLHDDLDVLDNPLLLYFRDVVCDRVAKGPLQIRDELGYVRKYNPRCNTDLDLPPDGSNEVNSSIPRFIACPAVSQ